MPTTEDIEEIVVHYLSEDDVRRGVINALNDLGMTADELRAETKAQRFSCDLAQRTWLALKDHLHLAD